MKWFRKFLQRRVESEVKYGSVVVAVVSEVDMRLVEAPAYYLAAMRRRAVVE